MSENSNQPSPNSFQVSPHGAGITRLSPAGNSDAKIAPAVVAAAKNLSPEQLAAVKQSYRQAGFSQEAIETAFNQQSAPAGPQVDWQATKEVNPAHLLPQLQGNITDDATKAAVEHLVKHWTGDPVVLKEALNKAGVILKPDQAQTQPPTGKLDPNLDPPDRIDGYRLNYSGLPAAKAMDSGDLAAFDQEIRTAFQAAGVATAVAQETLEAGLEAVSKFADATPEQQELHRRELEHTLRKMVGGKEENYATLIVTAAEAFRRIPEPIRRVMKEGGFTLHPRVIVSLYQAELRRQQREDAQEK